MARVGRLAGALLVETGGGYHLVGHLKQPCDFAAAGLARPDDLDARAPTGVAVEAIGPVRLAAPWLVLDLEGAPLIRLLAERLVIARTGLVSERVWRLVTHEHADEPVDARWLGALPAHVWGVIAESLLRCA